MYVVNSLNNSTFENQTSGVTDPLSEWRKKQTLLKPTMLFVCGFVGNSIALTVLACTQRAQRRTLFYRIVLSLVVTDLVGIVATSPVVVAVYMNGLRWIGGWPLCQFFSFMMTYSGCATIMLICAMSFERYACIMTPYFYYTRLKPWHSMVVVFVCVLLSSIIAVLPVMGVGTYVIHSPGTWCFFDYYSEKSIDKAFSYIFSVTCLLCIALTVVCNIIVLKVLMNSCGNRVSRGTNNFSIRRGKANNTEKEMVILLAGMTVTVCCCYIPLLIGTIRNAVGASVRDKRTDLLNIRLASLNQTLDPWVYILLRKQCFHKIARFVRCGLSTRNRAQTMGRSPSGNPRSISQVGLILRSESSPSFTRCQSRGLTRSTDLTPELISLGILIPGTGLSTESCNGKISPSLSKHLSDLRV